MNKYQQAYLDIVSAAMENSSAEHPEDILTNVTAAIEAATPGLTRLYRIERGWE